MYVFLPSVFIKLLINDILCSSQQKRKVLIAEITRRTETGNNVPPVRGQETEMCKFTVNGQIPV